MTNEEFIRRLEGVDDETLQLLAKYATEKRSLVSASAVVSSVLTSITGLVAGAVAFFPDLGTAQVALAALLLGITVVFLVTWQRRKAETRILMRLADEANASSSQSLDVAKRKQLIEQFLKMEGL